LIRLFDQAVDPVYVVDGRWRIVYLNEACARWVGRERSALVGAECRYHSQLDEQGEVPPAARLCPPPQVFGGEYATVRVSMDAAQGNREISFLPLLNDDGDVSAVWATVAAAHDAPATSSAAVSALDAAALHARLAEFRRSLAPRYRLERLVGDSPAMRRVRSQVVAAAQCSANVLIVGPPGSGRGHVARTIHFAAAGSESVPFVPLACALLGAELLQTTIRALARPVIAGPSSTKRGTLLLNDVDLLPAEARAELLGFLRTGELPLRVIATARQPLADLPGDDVRQLELAGELSTLVIELLPLAQRREDLPLLAQSLLEERNAESGKQLAGFTAEALERLAHYSWPGEHRELRETVAHAHAQASTPWIAPDDLPRRLSLAADAARHPRPSEEQIDLEKFLGEIERELIERALARARGNKTLAAKLLGMTRPRLYRRLVQLGLAEPEDPEVVFE
jgi:DNA-binding NtrC family response regulator